MFRLLRRFVLAGLVCALLALNVLTLTWSAATAAFSGLLGALGVGTVYSQLDNRARSQARQLAAQKKRMARQQRSLRKIGGRIRARTLRGAAVNLGSMPAESIPLLGWAVAAGATGYELSLACQNLRDLDALHRDLGLEPEKDRDLVDSLCQPDLAQWRGPPHTPSPGPR